MYSLIIDTSTNFQYIAIAKNKNIICQIKQKTQNSHLEIIHSNLDKIIKKSQISFKDLNEVIVVNGPGSFTGVRIGVICAKVICLQFKIKLLTISTLKLLATSNLDKNILVIKLSKLKNLIIKYDIIQNKIGNVVEYSSVSQNEKLSQVNLNYENIFKHDYLLVEVSYLDIQPNYVETPNFIKKNK